MLWYPYSNVVIPLVQRLKNGNMTVISVNVVTEIKVAGTRDDTTFFSDNNRDRARDGLFFKEP